MKGRVMLPIVAVVVGMIVAFIFMIAIESYSHSIYPTPEGLNPMDPADKEAFQAFLDAAPLGMFLIVLLGHIVAAFFGGFIAAFINKSQTRRAALIVGMLLTMAGIVNLSAFAHPIWFGALDLPSYIIFAWLGSKLVKKEAQRTKKHSFR